jgi:hypothetical protein
MGAARLGYVRARRRISAGSHARMQGFSVSSTSTDAELPVLTAIAIIAITQESSPGPRAGISNRDDAEQAPITVQLRDVPESQLAG